MTEPRLPVGAEFRAPDVVRFRVWAPGRSSVVAEIEGGSSPAPLSREGDGYWSASVSGLRPGDRYRYRVDGEGPYPDPASRFQPDGPMGPSMIVDPDAYAWMDSAWSGLDDAPHVLYEMHVGTFTPGGTWASAAERLDEVRDIGVDVIEVLPVADFPGRFGWGYDGVNLFAPTRLYGTPDDFRRFVDGAHGLGMGVILDVVYNHFGPRGCFLAPFSGEYFTDRHRNEWGSALNFDGPGSAGVREYVTANAVYWIREFRLDGLRFDATQAILDDSPTHVIAEIVRAARKAAGRRRVLLVAENESQDARLLRPASRGGFGLDAAWNDDFHHASAVALTGRREAYRTDYRGTPQELISAAKWGFLYQGQRYTWQKKSRGTPALDLQGGPFVTFLENHDQVANGPGGRRLVSIASPATVRAMTALLLLGPGFPMLFQGQEFGADAPFLYFADHPGDLAAAIREGRRDFLSQFPSSASLDPDLLAPDPGAEATFRRCVLDDAQRAARPEARALHRDLIRLRRTEPAFRRTDTRDLHGAVLATHAFCLRFGRGEREDRLLLVNLGADVDLDVQPEPLLAPPSPAGWVMQWSSEEGAYGGRGTTPWNAVRPTLQGPSAVVLRPGGA